MIVDDKEDDFEDSDEVDLKGYTASDLSSLGKSREPIVKKCC